MACFAEYQPGNADPVSSSAGSCEKMQVVTSKGMVPYPPARALDKSEIPGIVEDYANAARNAIAAGVACVKLCCGCILWSVLALLRMNMLLAGPLAAARPTYLTGLQSETCLCQDRPVCMMSGYAWH